MKRAETYFVYLLSFVVIAIMVFYCNAFSCAQEQDVKNPAPFSVFHGTASWYGPGFHTRLTANGENYDMFGLTCAHREWKFGLLVEVCNKNTMRKCIVRVNDRGPVSKSFIMDLSYGAAMAISSRDAGKARVRLTVVGDKNGQFDKNTVFFLFLDDKIVLPKEKDVFLLAGENHKQGKDTFFSEKKQYYQNIAGGVTIFQLTQKHLKRLYQAKIYNAKELLVSIENNVCLGPFSTMKEAEEFYHRVVTIYPHASVWLEPKEKARALIVE